MLAQVTGSSGSDLDSRVALAKFTSTPRGTQYRVSSTSPWQNATTSTYLYKAYESRNSYSEWYSVEIYSEVELSFFNVATDIEFGTLLGEALYKDIYNNWNKVVSGASVSAIAVWTANHTILPLSIRGSRGTYAPKGWPSGGKLD